MVERASSDVSCSPQNWCGRCWGPGRCYPSWQPAQPPWLWCHRECPTRVWALLAAKPEWGSQAVSFRPPQLLPSPWSTELLLLKNRFFPQIWWWCARLMENPSSCCCKTPFPQRKGSFIAPRSQQRGCIYNSFWFLQEILFGISELWLLWGYWDQGERHCMCGFPVEMGGEALCFKHCCSHSLKLSLNLMSPHLLHCLLLSAPAGQSH